MPKLPKIKIEDGLILFAAGRKEATKTEWLPYAHVLERIGGTIYDSEIEGYHVKRTGINKITHRLYFRFKGSRQTFTIERFPSITCSGARRLIKKTKEDIAGGTNPLEKKKSERQDNENTLKSYLNHEYSLHMERAIAGKDYIELIRNAFPDLLKKPLSDINKTDLVKWVQDQMRKYRKHEYGYSSDSVKRRYSALKSLMSHAVRNDVIQTNPFDKMDKLEFHRDEHTQQQAKRTYLEKEQMIALLQSIDNYDQKLRAERRNSRKHGKPHLPDLDNLVFASHHKPMLLILFYMGMRSGDIIGLEWTHVIDTPFACNITKVLEKTRRKVKDPFVLPMPPQVRQTLKDWRKQQGNPKGRLVFPNPKTGKRMDKKCLQRCWTWIKNDADFHEDLQLYTLRHNFTSWLIMNGTPLKVVADMTGHKSTAMIEKHYGHLIAGATQQASEDFANLLEAEKTKLI